jgi:hypothetical protein
MRALVVAIVMSVSGVATAGEFCGGRTPDTLFRAFERYAAGNGWKHWDEFFKCMQQNFGREDSPHPYAFPDKERARITTACTKAIALPASQRDAEPDSFCGMLLMTAGAAKVGDRDFVAELVGGTSTWQLDGPAARLFSFPIYELLAATGDPRVRPKVLADFTAFRDRWRNEKHGRNWDTYNGLEQQEIAVVHALEKVGTADDIAIVDEIDAEHPHAANWQRMTKRARATLRGRTK